MGNMKVKLTVPNCSMESENQVTFITDYFEYNIEKVLDDSYEYIFTVYADEGFIITNCSYPSYFDSNLPATISADKSRATFTISNAPQYTQFGVKISPKVTLVSDNPMGNIRVEGSNITATGEDVSTGGDIPVEIGINVDNPVPSGKEYKVVVTADEGFIITYADYVKETGSNGMMVISSDGKTATATRLVNQNIDFTCSVEVEASSLPEIILFNGTETLKVTAENLTTGDIINVPYNTNVSVDGEVDYKITGVGVEGYEIVYASYTNYFGITTQLTVKSDKTVEVVIKGSEYLQTGFRFDIEATTIEVQPPQKISGFNHLYLINNEKLKDLAGERFELVGTEINDLGKYIINVMELPFTISDNEIGVETNIILGYKLMKTRTPELLNDELIIDFGEITVPPKYNNSYDFMNTEIKLHVPFSDTIDIDVSYVVNQTIRVIYIIDLYSGNTTINIYSSLIDNIFTSVNTSIGRNIPFITAITGDAIGGLTDNRSLINNILKPFVEVIRTPPYEVDNIFNSNVSVQGLLLGVLGFIRVDDMILNSNATINEKQRILTILKSGVYIK